jgi:hypothetical protein
MSPDEELMVIFGAMHLAALVFGGVLFAMFLHSETVTPWQDPDDRDDGGGGGGNDRPGDKPLTTPPGGGIPLPDAEQAPVRLRDEHDRFEIARPPRRRVREPDRTPVP